ncbi:ParB/RepB/Spo0J family partition protein, partial [Maritalea sp.]|uniref:ParB/RepB/Spo0J family partition protein n=1 Tax=Maritalea sp. TaxID=2003361 RepID=UPI003EF2A095
MNNAIEATNALPVSTALESDERISYIPFNQLHRTKKNVRTINPKDDPQDKELHAAILAVGLLENLIVFPDKDGYAVPAGGRRFGSLELHVKEGNMSAERPIPCLVRTEEESTELSLIENLTQKSMHPADTCAGFLTLQKDGATIEDIAARFGYTVTRVKQYLRLAQLNATLLKHFRANRLTMDQAMAYCATPDKRLQLSVFRSLGDNLSASVHSIRRHIEDSKVRSDTGLAKFVGIDAYVQAGGTYWDDLFTGVKLLNDMSILVTLADEKLAAVADSLKLEGWKWAITDHQGVGHRYEYRRMPFSQKIPEEEQAKLDALEEEIDSISDEIDEMYNSGNADSEAELERRRDEKMAEFDSLEFEHVQRYREYDNKDQGGCIVTFSHATGKQAIFYGLQSDDDIQSPVSGDATQIEADEYEGKQKEKKASLAAATNGKSDGMNKKLIEDLGRYRREIIRAELLDNPSEARDLLEFHLCQSHFSRISWESPLSFRVMATEDSFNDEDSTTHKAADAIARHQNDLNLSWLKSDKLLKQYTQFRDLSIEDRNKL